MRSFSLFLSIISVSVTAMAQEHQHALHLSAFGSENAIAVLSYESRFTENFSLQGGVGITNLGGATMVARVGGSYLLGTDHLLELSLVVDIYTGSRTVPGTNGVLPNFFIGYRYEFQSGFVFRSGFNTTKMDDYYFDSDWLPKVLTVSVGYAF